MDPVSILVQLAIALVLMTASYAITASMTKRQPAQKPASIEDFDFPRLDEGTAQSVVFGDVWVKDWMVLWYGDYQVTPIKTKKKKK
jgi:hypothetical protein